MPAAKLYKTTISKLVHGGQGIGVLEDGRKCFVWGALPEETVDFIGIKHRKDYVEGVVRHVLTASRNRIEPIDPQFMSTSPWQILEESCEDEQKAAILKETFERANVYLPIDIAVEPTTSFYNYRNKMEYSFYGDEDGLHLALFNRGSHQKQIVTGSSIAKTEIDAAARELVEQLNSLQVRASDLKTLVLRANQNSEVVAALYVKQKNFIKVTLTGGLKGLAVVYSNPKSPASIRTEDIYILGDISLQDTIDGTSLSYDVFSFFQVNVPVFIKSLQKMKKYISTSKIVDMYSGVGSIGLSVSDDPVLIETDQANVTWVRKNIQANPKSQFVHASSEQATEYISPDRVLVVDPPRAGLHEKVVEKILEVKPQTMVYLSCNPSTQARDIKLLESVYEMQELTSYNFFPRTPHIESLAYLVRR